MLTVSLSWNIAYLHTASIRVVHFGDARSLVIMFSWRFHSLLPEASLVVQLPPSHFPTSRPAWGYIEKSFSIHDVMLFHFLVLYFIYEHTSCILPPFGWCSRENRQGPDGLITQPPVRILVCTRRYRFWVLTGRPRLAGGLRSNSSASRQYLMCVWLWYRAECW